MMHCSLRWSNLWCVSILFFMHTAHFVFSLHTQFPYQKKNKVYTMPRNRMREFKEEGSEDAQIFAFFEKWKKSAAGS